MNSITALENIGGNIMTNNYYKFINDSLCDLENDDYNKVITNDKEIKLTFPLGINGIISPVYNYTNNGFNLESIINIIKDFYSSEISDEERKILIEQSDEDDDLSIYNLRIDLLDYSNLCYFQGIEINDGIYNILLGS